MKVKTTLYAAIRKSEDGNYFIDISTLSGVLAESTRKALRDNNKIPGWANSNPIVKYEKITLFTGEYYFEE